MPLRIHCFDLIWTMLKRLQFSMYKLVLLLIKYTARFLYNLFSNDKADFLNNLLIAFFPSLPWYPIHDMLICSQIFMMILAE